jgi:UDP-N-acetylmuramoyl-tripeptide--D-alanyl-D-alanine ligase
MNLSVNDLLEVTHLRAYLISKLSKIKTINRVSTDSRTVRKGDLFVALRGEKFDGHTFINEIKQKGAIAAVVDEKWFRTQSKISIPCIVVKNTIDAFGELARIYRRKFSIPILVVAGSNGKTTTKDLLAHTLGTSFNVLKTQANFNNQVGLPHMLLSLKKTHQLAILEIGTNHPGEIAWLTNVAEPTHALVTNIGREHLEFFKNLDGVAREELSTLAITEELGGFGFLNYDDPYILQMQAFFEEWSITYGKDRRSDICAKSLGFDAKGRQRIKVSFGKNHFIVKVNILADYAANMVAGVVAVAVHFRVKIGNIRKALESYAPHSKRMEVIKTKSGITIINDAYNANPESFQSALKTLVGMRSKAKKYVAAGDMFELGASNAKEHRLLGELMSEYRFQKCYLTGNAMKHALKSLRTHKRDVIYGTKNTIIEDLKQTLKRGDILLVKGSRGMKMEEIVNAIIH